MRLANLKEFRRLVYTPDSAPALRTLRAGIWKIPGGRRINGRYYVDLDAYDRANNLMADIESRGEALSKNPVLQGLI